MAKPQRARLLRRHTSRPGAPARSAFNGIPLDQLARLRRGAYVRSTEWASLFSEGRLRTLADGVAIRCQDPFAVFSHAVAAALWRLPLFKVRGDRVDMIFPHPYTRRNGPDVVRHQASLRDDDVVVLDGLRVTSLDRTVYDVIRTLSVEAAVVAFDAALRLVAWNESSRSYDLDEAARFRALVEKRIAANAGARGIRQARFVSAFADGRAQLPGESVSRLWAEWLGLPTPVLQYRVDLNGAFALLDMAWPELGRWWEFDGAVKYADPDFMEGRSIEQVIADQRGREEAVSLATGWRCDRHGFDQMETIDDFARYLRAIGMY